MRVFLLSLFAGAPMWAQNGAPAKTAPTGTIAGHVFYADTNGPARLAQVLVEPAEAIDGFTPGANKSVSAHFTGVQTMPDGSFTVPHVAPGTYYVYASAPGYLSPLAKLGITESQLSSPDKAVKEAIARTIPRVTVSADRAVSADLTLERGAAVSGTVLYDDGSPASGIRVKLLTKKKDKWEEIRMGPVQTSASIQTDDRGTFRIPSLPAREYLLAAELTVTRLNLDMSGGATSMYNDDTTIPVYSGNKFRTRDAAAFTLKPGEERPGEDIQIPLGKLHTVTGSITAARDGHTVNGGQVALLYADDRTEAVHTKLGNRDEGWTLSFVPEGDYIVRVTDGADTEYEEISNGPGVVPPTHTKSTTVHSYATGEQPLHVEGEVQGLAVPVPEKKGGAKAGE